MTKNEKTILVISAIAALMLIPMATGTGFTEAIKKFLPSVESFSAKPVWDFEQWSWGYGTAAGYDKNKKPAGTITPERAMQDLLKVVNNHYGQLSPQVKRKLTPNQWAALLSFSYNLGSGVADNLIPNINSHNDQALFTQWKKYIYAGGKPLQGLISRRQKEVDLWRQA